MPLLLVVDDELFIDVHRMKRSLAEDQPTVFGGEPDKFATPRTYDCR